MTGLKALSALVVLATTATAGNMSISITEYNGHTVTVRVPLHEVLLRGKKHKQVVRDAMLATAFTACKNPVSISQSGTKSGGIDWINVLYICK